MKEEIDSNYVMNFLRSNDLGVLSTVDKKGNPSAAPMYHITEENLSLLFTTRKNTEKVKNINNNTNVIYTVTNNEHNETVQVQGKIEFVEPDEIKISEVFDLLAQKFTKLNRSNVHLALLSHKGSEVILLRLKPKKIRIRRYYEGGLDEKEITKF